MNMMNGLHVQLDITYVMLSFPSQDVACAFEFDLVDPIMSNVSYILTIYPAITKPMTYEYDPQHHGDCSMMTVGLS